MAPDSPAARPFIDAHAHLFPDRLLAALWRYFRQDGFDLWHEGDAAAVSRGLLRGGAERIFVLTYAHKGGVAEGLNAWLHEVCRHEPRWVPFGAAHPDDADFARLVTTCLDDYGFAGLKLHCSVQRLPCDDPRLFPAYELLQERGRAVIVHAGKAPYDDPHTGLKQAERLAARFPDLTIVVAHMGMWDLHGFVALAQAYPNVYLDCAAILTFPRLEAHPNYAAVRADIPAAMAAVADKLMWGSDYPFIESAYDASLRALDDLGLPPAVVERIRYGTARDLLRRIRPQAVHAS